ncbi:hypothetical protein JR316_0005664 [Psilocybe cubensis]|uniref:Uncharacterized protein n=2 Tax=Psilocybe cubensis TaxID=181762 RepID=A0ACB8H1M2_PSICU|nr:hypothetical protein JR316_0005664 [Psilocybe cubensis]KAH9481144.1 hypothetical protein JR316_0005664 [Psilocybe cubensis]
MANQHQYMHQPNPLYPSAIPSYRNVSMPRQETPVASTSSIQNSAHATGASTSGPSSSNIPQSSFRAPAHKHAHHLHSIPPREKSTRTLIIDHMLWVHGRTRFAQARAELGMTDRTGGPTSPNYIHRKRPESYEEDDEEGSEGEEVVALKARAGGPGHPHNDDEDERLGRQDLALARSLRLRAEGLEKVVISMLDQPPPIHPINDEDILTPPTSPKLTASNAAHPHRLPNGVRLRLALGTIVNDLFARQAPSPPYRHTHATNVTTPNTAKSAAASTPPDHSPQSSVVPSPSDLPNALATLAPVSGAFAPVRRSSPIRPSQNQQQQYHNYSPGRSNSGHQGYTQTNSPRNMHMQYPSIQHQQQSSQPLGPPMQSTNRPHASQRTRALYAVGADPSTANSPPAFRCPRHLHTGCEICVEAKSPPRQTGSSNSRGRGSSFGGAGGGGVVAPGGGGITGWEDGSGIGSGLLRPGVRGSALRRKVREDGKGSTGAGNTKLSKLIPRFIRLSALVAAELGREARGEEDTNASEDGKERDGVAGRGATPSASGSAYMGTPRSEAGWTIGGGRYSPLPPPASPSLASRNSRQPQQAPSAQTQAQNRMYEFALRPSSEWYMLLAGLLTRAVLEGYLTAGWTGLQAVQCLLLVGLGINEHAGKENVDPAEIDEDDVDDDEFSSLDPDELPNLVDAIKILFPSLRDQENEFAGIKSKGEEEYEMEMHERLKRFYDIPASTPDCATHMEDLAWQYPAEPVERAAVRFCEAIAKWRGKPELETYKKKPQPAPIDALNTSPGGTATAMTIESLVHSNPSSPMIGDNSNAGNGDRSRRKRLKKPSIDVYFIQSSPSSAAGSAPPVTPRRGSFTWNRSGSNLGNMNMNNSSGTNSNNKRYRDDDGGRPESAKRMFV